jgi:sugar phosphate isomerase/epimerase
MKLGFVDAILAKKSLKDILEFAQEHGFSHVETCCWPVRSPEEIVAIRSASQGIQESLINIFIGITHIDVQSLTGDKVAEITELQRQTGVKISSLAYYGNPLAPGEESRQREAKHLMAMIDAAKELNISLITTFIGRDQTRTLADSIVDAIAFWTPIIRYAESGNVRVAIENCPMYFTADQWPGGQNLFMSPSVWRRMFEAIPSSSFGLCFDPSHMIFQHMNYIQPIYDFADKIFHVHFKDAKVLRHKLDELGIMAYPLQYTSQKIPGHGDINWGAFVSALNDIGYLGGGSIEIEDAAFEGTEAGVKQALVQSKRFLSQYIAMPSAD